MRSLRRRIRVLESRGWHGEALVNAYRDYRLKGVLPSNPNLAKHIRDIADRIDAIVIVNGEDIFCELDK